MTITLTPYRAFAELGDHAPCELPDDHYVAPGDDHNRRVETLCVGESR